MAGKTSLKIDKAALQEIYLYAKALRHNGVNYERLILFGSYAKGINKPWSDIDLCVVSPDFGKNYADDLVRLHQLRNTKTTLIDPQPFTEADLNNKWNPLAAEVTSSGINVEP